MVDEAIAQSLLGGLPIVTVGGSGQLLHGLAAGFGENAIDPLLDMLDVLSHQGDVSRLALDAAQGLMDHDLGVGRGVALALGTGGQQEGTHGGGDTGGHGADVAADAVLHHIVDGHASGDTATRAVDVHNDVSTRITLIQVAQLLDNAIRRHVIDFASKVDDAVGDQFLTDQVGCMVVTVHVGNHGGEDDFTHGKNLSLC